LKVSSISKVFFGLFIVLSGFTRTLAPPSSGILGRLTIADIFGFLGLLMVVLFSNKLRKNRIAGAALLFIVCLSLGLASSQSYSKTFMEILVHLFLVLVFIAIMTLFRDENDFKQLLLLTASSAFIVSFIGIYDVFAMNSALPRIMPGRSAGEANATFRNAGQAGAFILVMISILFPLFYSKLYTTLKIRHRRFIKLTFIMSIVFLILTGKIAAYLGFIIGLVAFVLSRLKIKLLISITAISFVLLSSIAYVQVYLPDTFQRINGKINSRIIRNVDGSRDVTKEGFMAENIGAALESFRTNPILGSGIGGIKSAGYHSHEIHSSYFKIIGETGLVGILGYIYFMGSIFTIYFGLSGRNYITYYEYLYLAFPFMVGNLLSWGYTYHMRKREFWIMLALMLIIRKLGDKVKYHNGQIGHI